VREVKKWGRDVLFLRAEQGFLPHAGFIQKMNETGIDAAFIFFREILEFQPNFVLEVYVKKSIDFYRPLDI